jgi:hypothetical protein
VDTWITVGGTLAGTVIGAAIAFASARIQVNAAKQIARNASERAMRERRIGGVRAYVAGRLTETLSARSEAERAFEKQDVFHILLPAMQALTESYAVLPRNHVLENPELFATLDDFARSDREGVELFSKTKMLPMSAEEKELLPRLDELERAAMDALDAIDTYIVG